MRWPGAKIRGEYTASLEVWSRALNDIL